MTAFRNESTIPSTPREKSNRENGYGHLFKTHVCHSQGGVFAVGVPSEVQATRIGGRGHVSGVVEGLITILKAFKGQGQITAGKLSMGNLAYLTITAKTLATPG